MCKITEDDILRETLHDLQAMRMVIGSQYRWYCHLTPVTKADSIRDKGLLLHADAPAPQPVEAAIGSNARNIICVHPLGTDIVPRPVQLGPFICLAFENQVLPPCVGLDWSYDSAVGIACVLREETPNKPIGEIFVEAVKRRGSMIVYNPIPRDALRVCTKGCRPDDPENWPMLTETANGDLTLFDETRRPI